MNASLRFQLSFDSPGNNTSAGRAQDDQPLVPASENAPGPSQAFASELAIWNRIGSFLHSSGLARKSGPRLLVHTLAAAAAGALLLGLSGGCDTARTSSSRRDIAHNGAPIAPVRLRDEVSTQV